jgi:hypothetical protein
MCKSIEALGKTLVAILTLMNRKLVSTAILEIVATSIFSCQDGIERLQKKLDKVKIGCIRWHMENVFEQCEEENLVPFQRKHAHKNERSL